MEAENNIFQQISKAIHPYKVEDKIRLGRNFDGGYIISRQVLDNSNIIISLGINNEWSFEKSCLNFKKFDLLVMIDDQMSATLLVKHVLRNLMTCLYRPLNAEVRHNFVRVFNTLVSYNKLINKQNVKYHKLRIGSGPGEINLTNLLVKYNLQHQDHLFFKIDIEGSEYSLIDSLIQYENKISGMVIEFHNILQKPTAFLFWIKKLNEFYSIYHVHFNNYTDRNEFISDAIEVSFANKVKYSLYNIDEERYPIINLDFPCDASKKDYPINSFI